MKFILALVIALPLPALSANFGDEVASCIIAKGGKSGAAEFPAYTQICEKEVEEKRNGSHAEGTSIKVRATLVTDAFTEYTKCVYHAIPELDDKTSDATTIALGLHGFCLSKLSPLDGITSRIEIEQMAANVRPSIIQLVLAARVRDIKIKRKGQTPK